MELIVGKRGEACCVYDEAIDVHGLGNATIRRASQLEPDSQGMWWADLSAVGGPKLGPFRRRSEGLTAERQWLIRHWWLWQRSP